MDTRAFLANSMMENAFAARRNVYCGAAAAINHEANSEGNFSFAGRAFNKFRTAMKSEQLYDTVVAAAGEKRKTTEPADVQHTYKRLWGEVVAAAFWGSEAAVAALAAAAADPAAAAAGGD
jgi:histone H3/H4